MKTGNSDPASSVVDIARATSRGRLALLALIVLAIALLLCYQLFLLPFFQAVSSSGNLTQSIATLKLILGGCFVFGAIPALFLIKTGWKTLHAGQFPLPDTWVWRDTPIKHGPAAIRSGRLHILAGVIGLLFCTVLAGYSWLMLDRLLVTHALPAGVTLISAS